MELTGDGPSADVSTHCQQELMHAVWVILLDDDFLYAYEHGIIISCPVDASIQGYLHIWLTIQKVSVEILLELITFLMVSLR